MRACFTLGLFIFAVGCAGVGTPETQNVAIGGGDLAPLPGADLAAIEVPSSHDMAVNPGDDLAAQVPVTSPDLAPPPLFDLATGCTDHLVLNEVKVAGSGTASGVANDEFIEIYNPCGTTISLANWTIVHRAASGTTENIIATLTKSIGGSSYYLIAETQCACSTTADVTYTTGTLAATGGGIGLRNPSGTLVDSVGYGTGTDNAFVEGAPAAAPAGGASIARHPNGTDTDHNDADFTVATTPTPRAANQ